MTVVINDGDAPTFPVFVVEGNEVWLRNDSAPGQPYFLIHGSVPAGTVVNFKDHTAIAPGGVSLYNQIAQPATWWALVPGANLVNIEGGTATVTFASSWF